MWIILALRARPLLEFQWFNFGKKGFLNFGVPNENHEIEPPEHTCKVMHDIKGGGLG